jgi:hypothetical protein
LLTFEILNYSSRFWKSINSELLKMDIQSSMFASEDEYSFFLDPDTPIKDAEKNLKHPFVLSIVSVFVEIMTSSDLEKRYSNLE